MDVLGWIWWLISTIAGWVLALVWLLVGGWVSTLLQILVVIGLILAWKYGWRRAPAEAWHRLTHYWPRARAWLGRRSVPAPGAIENRASSRSNSCRAGERPRRRWSAVRLSSMLTLLMLLGLGLLALLPAR